MFLVKALLALALWWLALRLRLVPVRLMQYWFFFTSFAVVFPLCGLTSLFSPLQRIGVGRYYTERMCIMTLTSGFIFVRLLNPQIRMFLKFDANVAGKPRSWEDVPRHGFAVVSNHVSFWDIFAFLVIYPLRYMGTMRTLLKASLLQVPLFGPAMQRVGQFPVYFKSDEDGNFQVDKEKQAAVQQEVNRHIGEGGNIVFYPEGALNRNPPVLQPFRFGTFQTIFEHQLAAYYLVLIGDDQTWPRGSAMGGKPADICARVGAFPIDYATEDAKTVSAKMQAHMQTLYAEGARDVESVKSGKVPAGYKELWCSL